MASRRRRAVCFFDDYVVRHYLVEYERRRIKRGSYSGRLHKVLACLPFDQERTRSLTQPGPAAAAAGSRPASPMFESCFDASPIFLYDGPRCADVLLLAWQAA